MSSWFIGRGDVALPAVTWGGSSWYANSHIGRFGLPCRQSPGSRFPWWLARKAWWYFRRVVQWVSWAVDSEYCKGYINMVRRSTALYTWATFRLKPGCCFYNIHFALVFKLSRTFWSVYSLLYSDHSILSRPVVGVKKREYIAWKGFDVDDQGCRRKPERLNLNLKGLMNKPLYKERTNSVDIIFFFKFVLLALHTV